MTVFINKKRGLKFNIPGEKNKVIRFTGIIIAMLLAVSVILAIFCALRFFEAKHITIEAGQALRASDIVNNEAAVFGDGFDPDCVNHAGVYRFTVISRGEEISVRLKVKDETRSSQSSKPWKWRGLCPHGCGDQQSPHLSFPNARALR